MCTWLPGNGCSPASLAREASQQHVSDCLHNFQLVSSGMGGTPQARPMAAASSQQQRWGAVATTAAAAAFLLVSHAQYRGKSMSPCQVKREIAVSVNTITLTTSMSLPLLGLLLAAAQRRLRDVLQQPADGSSLALVLVIDIGSSGVRCGVYTLASQPRLLPGVVAHIK
jgi:hypothetical protein